MTEATCKRELELVIPADDVSKATEKIARQIARVARVPGFRPGKAPVTLVRRRFAEEIKSEVLESLVPEVLQKEMTERKLYPVTRPQVDKLDFPEEGPVKFRAVFEVFPEFELADCKGLAVEVPEMHVTDEDLTKTLEDMRERHATLAPVEGRTIADGDFAVLKLVGVPEGGSAEPIQAENVLCHVGAEETMDAFNQHLRGAEAGQQKRFEAEYPADYPDAKLAGKKFHYTVDILGIKVKQLPELNDEFAKDVAAEFKSLDELKAKLRANLEAARDQRQRELGEQKLLEALVARHDFPVPEALVEQQMDSRLERMVRQLAMQGVDPRAVNVDWAGLRHKQHDRAVSDVKAEILLDRIATAENIDATEEDVEREIAAIAARSQESPDAVRARLTKQGALDRLKSKLRSDRTLEWLYSHAKLSQVAKAE